MVLPAPDGKSVYVGGLFTSIAGAAVRNLAQVNVADGSLVTTFNPATVDGRVLDLRLANNRLWVAGAFTHIATRAQRALATVNPVTGKFDPFMRQVIAGVHNGGTTTVLKIDVNSQGTRLVGLGNFDTVDAAKRHQLFVLDISGVTSTNANWQTAYYETPCSRSFNSYMRDLDFSPDGRFFVVSTTGAYGGVGAACDSTARFETGATGTGIRPSWINNTGGDTTYAVEITDSIVYTGGHARWQNNPYASDSPGPGAVSRPGIAALDPINGLPLSWNPTRDRGVGVFDFLIDDLGLWVASDTTRIGANYLRSRIALLPVGGTTFPGVRTPSLPNDVHIVRTNNGGIQKRSYSGTAFGTAQTVPTGGLTTNNVRGAFMLNGYLYIAWSDGTFDRRTFDGTTYGTPEPVNTGGQLTAMTEWSSDIQSMTGTVLRLRPHLLHPQRHVRALLPLLHAGEQDRGGAAAHRQRQRDWHRLPSGAGHVRRRRQLVLVDVVQRPAPARLGAGCPVRHPGRGRGHGGVELQRRRLQLGLAARAVPLPGP